MAFPARLDPYTIPANRLFPEQYEASKRMIVRDFALIGATMVLGVVLAALMNLAVN